MQKHGDTAPSARDGANADDCVPAGRRLHEPEGLGPWLQARRLALGLSVADVSHRLNLQSAYIEALETDNFAALPGPPYLAGYVRAMAQVLDLDPESALARLRIARPTPQTAGKADAAPLKFPRPSIERHLPVSALVSASIAISIAAYGYWYVTTSAEMGRPLLSPVAELEATTAPPEEPRRAPFAPGPLQPLGVPVLAESVDAANALSPEEMAKYRAASMLEPRPNGHVPRPRPGSPAAEIWASTFQQPVLNADGEVVPSSEVAVRVLPSALPRDGEGLPAATSLAAYLPTVRLRTDLGPLRGADSMPQFVQTARGSDVSDEPEGSLAVARTQAFAAEPPSANPLARIGTPQSADVRSTGYTVGSPARRNYDLLATLPAAATDADAVPPQSVTIIADQQCWIEIRSADGRLVAQKLLQPGERFDVPRKPGLQLTAGNAGGIRVMVDGVTVAALGSVGQVVRGASLNPYHLLAQR